MADLCAIASAAEDGCARNWIIIFIHNGRLNPIGCATICNGIVDCHLEQVGGNAGAISIGRDSPADALLIAVDDYRDVIITGTGTDNRLFDDALIVGAAQSGDRDLFICPDINQLIRHRVTVCISYCHANSAGRNVISLCVINRDSHVAVEVFPLKVTSAL